MDGNFWLDRWQRHEIGFHQSQVQPALKAHWPKLSIASDAAVLVPLCGKSIDMAWLAARGHTVIGAELAEQAVDAFFAEQGVVPDVAVVGSHIVKSSGAIQIWCGDFFALDRQALPVIGAVYDRAALVAMPPEMQASYVAQISRLLPAQAEGLLIGLDYDTGQMQGPPFALSQQRVRSLYEATFDIHVIDARDGLTKTDHLAQRGLTRLEEASYSLRRRA